jgi:hypothetical protein
MQPRTDPDRHIEDARASLVAHLGELGRRFRTARAQIDAARARLEVPSQHIAAHPLPAVGAALALGLLLGLRGGGKRRDTGDSERGLARAALAGLVAIAVRAGKDLAMRRFTDVAQQWWEQRQQAGSSEYRTSYNRGVEPFFDH